MLQKEIQKKDPKMITVIVASWRSDSKKSLILPLVELVVNNIGGKRDNKPSMKCLRDEIYIKGARINFINEWLERFKFSIS